MTVPPNQSNSGSAQAAAIERAIDYEQELAKLEEGRIAGLENQATAILGLVVAIAAFSASAISRSTLEQHRVSIGVVVTAMFLSAGFAIAARGPRSLNVRFWAATNDKYGRLEARFAKAEADVQAGTAGLDGATILESWRARRAVTAYLAERKALWLTCALGCLLANFIAAAIAALVIAG